MKERPTAKDERRPARRDAGRPSGPAGGTSTRRRRRFNPLWFIMKSLMTLATIAAIGIAALFIAVETGGLDKTLADRAQSALNDAVGDRYSARVAKTAIRFANGGQIAIEARDVELVDKATGQSVSKTGAVRMALDPIKLLSGDINVTRIEADDVHFDTALLSTGKALDLSKLRIDTLPIMVEQGFAQLDLFGGFIDRAKTNALDVNGLALMATGQDGKVTPIGNARFTLTRDEGGTLKLDGTLDIEEHSMPFSVIAEREFGKAVSLDAHVSQIPLEQLGPKTMVDGQRRDVLMSNAATDLSATRATSSELPAISLSFTANPGTLRIKSIDQSFEGASIKAVYDFSKNSLEFLPSAMRFGDTNIPFTGGLIDLDRIDTSGAKGYGVDFVTDGATASTDAAGTLPMEFAARATGRFLVEDNALQLDKLTVRSRSGSMSGTMRMKFGGPDPEISFASEAENLESQTVKQLWPFWIAPRARTWFSENLFGGQISNASIAVFLPSERVHNADGALILTDEQMHLAFDISNARMNVAGDIPPLRSTTGHFEMRGERVEVNIKSGTSYFPSDRSVAVDGGTLVIPAVENKPLLAEMALTVSGSADALAELLTYKPLMFLSRTGLTPEDVAGNVRADVKATFGLKAKEGVTPKWSAKLALNGVDLMKPVDGHRLTDLTGSLDVTQYKAELDAKGKLNSVDMQLNATEPLNGATDVERKRLMTMNLSADEVSKLAPSLKDVVGGNLVAKVELLPDHSQKAEVDLTDASLKVPGTGWTKGPGIPAKSTFSITHEDDVQHMRDLVISGETFGAKGEVTTRDGKLLVADFKRVRLSGNDDFGVRIKPIKSGYDIAITGSSADIRAALSKLRTVGTSADPSGGKSTLLLRAKLDKAIGFNDESMSNVELAYAPFRGGSGKLLLSAVTSTGQALVGQVVEDANGPFVQITSGDAGTTFRFLGLYSRLQKGLLNTRIRPGRDGSWIGNLDIRDFRLANEEKLQTIVSTPTGADGRSLNKAVKRDIDVRSERFQRGFASFTYDNGALRVDNGVLRGEQVGATFQGVVRDRDGKMDMTGTFMPAYGLNRLFAELPVIGLLLGNGRDRGLLGITFKLTGPFDKPKLTINPLSIIAPGIFRQIFEFQ